MAEPLSLSVSISDLQNALDVEEVGGLAAGQFDPREVWFEFLTQQDDRVRPSHRALHGTVWRVGDPSAPVPPLDYGCRCFIRYVAPPGSQAAAKGYLPKSPLPAPSTVEGAYADFLSRPFPDFDWRAEVARLGKGPAADLLPRLAAALQAERPSLTPGQAREYARMMIQAAPVAPPAAPPGPVAPPPPPPAPPPRPPAPAPIPAPAPAPSPAPTSAPAPAPAPVDPWGDPGKHYAAAFNPTGETTKAAGLEIDAMLGKGKAAKAAIAEFISSPLGALDMVMGHPEKVARFLSRYDEGGRGARAVLFNRWGMVRGHDRLPVPAKVNGIVDGLVEGRAKLESARDAKLRARLAVYGKADTTPGRRNARESLRSLLTDAGITGKAWDAQKILGNVIQEQSVGKNVGAFHNPNSGLIALKPGTTTKADAALKAWAKGKPATVEQEGALGALFHESIHGVGPLKGGEYKGLLKVIEEVVTESQARQMGARMRPAGVKTSDKGNSLGVDTYAQKATGARGWLPYDKYMDELKRHAEQGLPAPIPDDKWHAALLKAGRVWKGYPQDASMDAQGVKDLFDTALRDALRAEGVTTPPVLLTNMALNP